MNAFARALETTDQHRFTLDEVLRMQEAGILDPDLYLYDAALSLEEVDGSNVGLIIEVAQTTLATDLVPRPNSTPSMASGIIGWSICQPTA